MTLDSDVVDCGGVSSFITKVLSFGFYGTSLVKVEDSELDEEYSLIPNFSFLKALLKTLNTTCLIIDLQYFFI